MAARRSSPMRGSHATFWRNPDDGKLWEVRFHFAELDGVVECVGVDLHSFRKEGEAIKVNRQLLGASNTRLYPLTSTVWRKIPIGELVQEAVRGQGDLVKAAAAGVFKDMKARDRRKAAKTIPAFERHDPSRRYWNEDRLVEVAEIYVKNAHRGGTPTKAVREHFNISASMASKLVRMCRDAGLLGEATPGKAGGLLDSRKGGAR